jgi:type I restriction enzyme R subunit
VREWLTTKKPIIDYLTQLGWEYLPPDEALRLRQGEKGLYLNEILESQLLHLNPGILDINRLSELLRKLSQLKPTIEGNRDALEWIRGQRSIFIPDEKRDRNIHLIDFEHPDNNVFHVTDEWRYQGLNFTNRIDLVFLINGIPVVVAEIKSADIQDGLSESVEQLQRYHQETPHMFIFPQVFVVTTPDLNLYYGSTWQVNRQHTLDWKNDPSNTYESKIKSFFEQSHFLHMLRDCILFLSQDDILSKVILRQHQTRAIEKVLQLIQKGPKQRALLWHTQGSGKTLTMITIASRLLQASQKAMPTVVMIVDRSELETQLLRNILAYGISTTRAVISKKDLQDSIESDYRGLIISTIQKFEGLQARANQREDVIVLVDAAYRSMGGTLGHSLIRTFPNATYIGFTDTPLEPSTRNADNVFKLFGTQGEYDYLDTYSITEATAEGTTVAVNYTLAPHDLQVDRATLEKDFFHLPEMAESDDIEELNTMFERSHTLKETLKSPQRIDKVAAFIAEHFQEHVDPLGFKAFLVALDREACALYKRALDQYLPSDWSVAVYSPTPYDQEYLSMYALRESDERKVRRDFLKSDYPPKILIVSQKLLTGFDAPILYCLYLDKPMRDHLLLQAISRVNRPYQTPKGQIKPYGLIIDFVGIFDQLNRVLAFSDSHESVAQDLTTLEQRFATLMQGKAQDYLLWARAWDDKAKELTIAHFEDKTRRDNFFTFFYQLQNIYDVLAPSSLLSPYLEDYKLLAQLFSFIQEAYTISSSREDVISNRTQAILNKRVIDSTLQLPGHIDKLSAQEFSSLKQSNTSEIIKILNLRKILATTIAEKAQSQPYLQAISEQAEALVQEYEDHQLTPQQALDQLEKLIQQYLTSEEERQKLSLDEDTYAIYTTLKLVTNTITPEQVQAINAILKHYPDYRWNEQQEKQVRIELYRILHPILGIPDMIKATNRLMKVVYA